MHNSKCNQSEQGLVQNMYKLYKRFPLESAAENIFRGDLTDERHSPTGAHQTLGPAERTHVNHVPIYLVHTTFPRVLFF